MMPYFNRSVRYRNKKGQTFGKGVWYDDNGKMMKPGMGYEVDRKTKTISQYNSDGTITHYPWKEWAKKKVREGELQVLKNDRAYGVPYIPEKKMTISIDKNSPSRKNAGATFSENLLDSIALNAKKAGLPFSTALGMVAKESTFGRGERAVGQTMLPWNRALNKSSDVLKQEAKGISYQGFQSPSLLVSNWKQRNGVPFHNYFYDDQGQLLQKDRSEDFYSQDIDFSRRKVNKYVFEEVSPLYHAFHDYKKDPYNYNYNDKSYPQKVKEQSDELVNYSPEIKEYMQKHNLHSDGGKISRYSKWDDLTLSEKSAMMQVAVRNGLRNLEDIRKAYNEFAEGGNLSDDEYYSIMERVAEENNPLWNKERVKEGHRPLTIDEEYLRLLNDNTYDYKGYYSKYPQSKANADTHWTDEFKTVWHPTFSNESVYSGRKSQYNPLGLTGGWWTGDGDGTTFMPMAWQLQSANQFKGGGYKPSAEIKNQIAQWEGRAMTGAKDPLSGKYSKNNSFESEARGFYNALPESIRERVLSNQGLADSLYSYSYNVGAGNFKKRVVPALERYYAGDGTAEDIAKSIWAGGDSKLKGLQRRREVERNGVRSALWDDQMNKVNQMINSAEPQFPAFMPYHSDVSASPLVTYEPPVVAEGQVQPLVEAAMAYSPEELTREEKRDRLRGISMMLGMLGQNGEYDDVRDILNTVGRMVPERNELAYGGGFLNDSSEPVRQVYAAPTDALYVAQHPVSMPVGRQSNWEEGALDRTNRVYYNYNDAKDGNMLWGMVKLRNAARWLQDKGLNPLGSGVSNCTLTATQWIDPENPINHARSIHQNPEKYGYTPIDSEDATPGNILISRNPDNNTYHTMLITGFADKDSVVNFEGKDYKVRKGEPLLTYSRGGHDSSFIRRNIPLSVYTPNSSGKTENHFFRYNYPLEVFLPEIVVTPNKSRK